MFCDNPGGSWLEEKRRNAVTDAHKSGRGATGKFLTGGITARTRGPVMVEMAALTGVRGANDEKRVPGEPVFDRLVAQVIEEGWDHDQDSNAVLICVNHFGQPYIVEGNTRIAVASTLGIERIKTEIIWFNGAEDEPGPFCAANGELPEFCSPIRDLTPEP